jgi:hypothetical protein
VLTVGKFLFKVPSVVVIPAVTVDVCYATTVTADFLDIIPDESCPLTTPAVESPEINVNLGPLFQKSLLGASQVLPLFPLAAADCTPGSEGCGRWELAGFNQPTAAAFLLDPENPTIAFATVMARPTTRTGPVARSRRRHRHQHQHVRSRGTDSGALRALVPGGSVFTVRSSVSPELTENAGFNGVADPNTLTRADALAVGVSGTLTINIGATPRNVFTSTLNADGTSPGGVTVAPAATASFAVYTLFHAPLGTQPTGVFSVALLGTSGLPAGQINPASVRLEGVAPLTAVLMPVGTGGSLNLSLIVKRFSQQAARLAGGQFAGGHGARRRIPPTPRRRRAAHT